MRKSRFTDERTIAELREGAGRLSAAWRHGAEILLLEERVRGFSGAGGTTTARAGRRESAVEAPCGRSNAECPGVERSLGTRLVTAERRLEAVHRVQASAAMSERRASLARPASLAGPLHGACAARRCVAPRAFARTGRAAFAWARALADVGLAARRLPRQSQAHRALISPPWTRGAQTEPSQTAATTHPREPAGAPTARWLMDFVRDTLVAGRASRLFTVVDNCTRESLVIAVDTTFHGTRVIDTLGRLAAQRGYPACVVPDNGPEFVSHAVAT